MLTEYLLFPTLPAFNIYEDFMLTTGSWVNETKPLNSGDSLVSQEMSYCLPTACPVLKVDVFSGFGQLLTFRKIYLRVLPSVVHSFLPCIYTLHFNKVGWCAHSHFKQIMHFNSLIHTFIHSYFQFFVYIHSCICSFLQTYIFSFILSWNSSPIKSSYSSTIHSTQAGQSGRQTTLPRPVRLGAECVFIHQKVQFPH